MICVMLLLGKTIKIIVIFYSSYDRQFAMLITSWKLLRFPFF